MPLEVFDEEQTVFQIKQYDDEINRLEERLENLRTERSQLKVRLDLYRASIAPIRRISEDVLVLILSETIAIDASMAIGRLLFVCRDWYRLVRNRRTLWSNIKSAPSEDARHVKRLTSYVKSAVRYSINMPLDIHLDLMDAGVPSWWMYAAEKLVPISDGDDGEGNLRQQRVRQWAQREDGASMFPLLRDYTHLLEQHLGSLIGEAGEVTRRWRSLTVFLDPIPFSTMNLVPLIFPRYPTPLLESLVIHMPRKTHRLLVTTCLPETPRLRSICWSSSLEINLASFIPCKTQVAHLQILQISSIDDLLQTTLFKNIQTLYLDFGRSYSLPPSESDSEPLAYPRLKGLTVFGPIPEAVIERLHAPNLHTLRLLNQPSVCPVLYSSFHSSHLHTLFLYAAVHDIVGVCKRFIARFDTVQDIVLLHHHDEVVRETLREMKGNGFPSARGYHFQYGERDVNSPKREIFVE